MKKRSGQVLILVLLIVVVSLAVGLSIASRNITNLRTSTQTEQSQRAFSAAEGGIENVLSGGEAELIRLKDISDGEDVEVGNLIAKVNVIAKPSLEDIVNEGNVAQVDLEGVAIVPGITKVQIEWAKSTDAQPPASIEVTQVNSSGGSFSQSRKAWAGVIGRLNEDGFSTDYDCSSTDFAHCVRITLDANPILLRIKPFWNSTEIRVSGVGFELPSQQYDVSSTAKTELGIVRKVQVTKTKLPQLPASFDYVLYSEGAITK